MIGPENIEGRVWTFGDHVDTDVIIPARFCTTYQVDELGTHAMAGTDPDFPSKISRGDIIVAGANFGCGSSRETAPLALLGAGVGAVVAASFGRIFFRNSINVGLSIFESPEASSACSAGDHLAIDPREGRIYNATRKDSYGFAPYSEKLLEIIECGGLVPYVRKRLGR